MKNVRLTIISIAITATLLMAFTIKQSFTEQQSTAKHVEWVSLEEAQKRCEKEPRRIFIDFTTSWCGWCKTMDQNTFSNPTIAEYMNKNFYCVSFNAETSDTVYFNGQQFVNKNPGMSRSAHDFAIAVLRGQLSYPSYGIFNKARNGVAVLQGYMPPQDFEPYLHYYAEDQENTISFDDYKKTFKTALPPNSTPATGSGH
jgi:thioredoxin-related protein